MDSRDEIRGFRSYASVISEVLDIETADVIKVATRIVSLGLVGKSSGRRIHEPDLRELALLTIASAAYAFGLSLRRAVAFSLQHARVSDPLPAQEVVGFVEFTDKVGNCGLVIRFPACIGRRLIEARTYPSAP